MSVSSTIDSSEAVEYINRQYKDLTRKLANKPKVLPVSVPNIKFEESEGIHVGNVIYNIHHHSPKTNSIESLRSSISSSKFEASEYNEKCMSRRNYWILSITIAIVLIGVAVSVSVYYAFRFDKNFATESTKNSDITTISPNDFEAQIISREQWNAGDLNRLLVPKLIMPIKRIIISHTRGQFCVNETNCISTVKSMQTQDSSLDDIPYNYLIGGDGRIYEGRGIEFQGQHTANLDATEYNSIGICIAFIGNYQAIAPDSSQISLLAEFVDFYKKKGSIAEDYIIVLQDDLKYNPIKAYALNTEIEKFDHFRPLYKIYRREEWNAQSRKDPPNIFETRPMNWVVIGHTASSLCSSLEVCKTSGRNLQKTSFNNTWSDILYNVFFGGDGYAFEGRGFDYWGSHHIGLNSLSIGVGVIGTFDNVPPNQAILNAIIKVFDDAMALGKLSQDYKIFGRSDFRGPGPGTAFMNVIKEWCRYGNKTNSC
ncbi:hypothetical protein ACKWTF_005315 [Chironomus riparius]